MREVWRQAGHLKQPLGSRAGSRTRQRGGSGLKSTTGGSRGGSSSIDRAGGVLHQITIKGPHRLSQLAWLSSRSLSVLGLSRPHSSQSCVGYGLPMHALGLSRELEAQRAVLVPLHWPQRYAPHPSSGSCAAILLEAAPVDPLGGATAGARARLDESCPSSSDLAPARSSKHRRHRFSSHLCLLASALALGARAGGHSGPRGCTRATRTPAASRAERSGGEREPRLRLYLSFRA